MQTILDIINFVFSVKGFICVFGTVFFLAFLCFLNIIIHAFSFTDEDGNKKKEYIKDSIFMLLILVLLFVFTIYTALGFFMALPVFLISLIMTNLGYSPDVILSVSTVSGILCFFFCPAGILFGFLQYNKIVGRYALQK